MAAKKAKKNVKVKSKSAPKGKAKVKASKKPAAKKMALKKPAPKASAAKPKNAKKVAAKPLAAKPSATMSAVAAMITPLDDRIVVAPEIKSETTAGGLVIPGMVETRPSRGKVLAKGRGRRNKKGKFRPLDVNVGDEVLFAEFAGTKINLAGNDVLILREEDLLGIVN